MLQVSGETLITNVASVLGTFRCLDIYHTEFDDPATLSSFSYPRTARSNIADLCDCTLKILTEPVLSTPTLIVTIDDPVRAGSYLKMLCRNAAYHLRIFFHSKWTDALEQYGHLTIVKLPCVCDRGCNLDQAASPAAFPFRIILSFAFGKGSQGSHWI